MKVTKINFMPYRMMRSFSVMVICALSISACQQNTPSDAAEKDTIAETKQKNSSLQTAATSVNYDFDNWQKQLIQPVAIHDIKNIKSSLGKVVSTDEKSLDYASNAATKYRFMDGESPYLDIIDSKDYLEVGWYFANENSNEKEEKISINHAKKAYQLARQLMGEEGGVMVKNILSGQVIKNRTINGYHIELAKCEFYGCMYVINKNKTKE